MIRQFNPSFLKQPIEPKYHQAFDLVNKYKILHLEIGAGVGMHPIQYCQHHPEIGLIAIERTREKFESFMQRFNSNQKKYPNSFLNLVPVHADVIPWLWFFDQQILFDKIWLLYPNPEPSNKNQRWIHAPFFSHLIERLKPEGEIELATNISTYADEVVEFAYKNWKFQAEKNIYIGQPRTHFEKKYLERGEICYQLLLRHSSKSLGISE